MKKIKIIVPVAILAIALLLFYIIVLHPRIKIYNDIQNTMAERDVTGLGTAIIPYEYDYQPGDDWIVIEERRCRFQIPSYFIHQASEIPEYTSPDNEESITVYEEGGKAEEPVLNADEYDEETMIQLRDGFEQLGYGIPDSEYNSLKAILSITEEDYNFWNINEAKAFSVLASYKTYAYAGIYCHTNGVDRVCYYYESESLCFIVSESYYDVNRPFYYIVKFYHPDNLHYVYDMYIGTSDPEVAFAIINSFELLY